MSLVGDDCFFFYNTSCSKGPACPYRHVEEAKSNDTSCPDWMSGKCGKVSCPLRHGEPPKNHQMSPCYFEIQASGCTKPYCPFLHKFPRQPGLPHVHSLADQPTVSGPTVVPGPGWPLNVRPPNVRPPVMGGPPPHHGLPPNRMWPPPMNRGSAPSMPPGRFPVPVSQPHMEFGMFHQPPPGPFPPMEPVIINLNSEESDQDSLKGSPMKPRTIVPPHQQTNKVDNPLDYFLNAKRWVDPNARIIRRSPSPPRYRHRDTPSPRAVYKSPGQSTSPRRSLSPRRSVSPGRTGSPGPTLRRRSISVDRGQVRRRSNSLDRSRSISPELNKDKRRFGRRLPSPSRRRSRSPVRDRFGNMRDRSRPQGARPDLRSRLKPPPGSQAPKLEEIKVSGPKIVSLKKEKKEEEEEKESEEEKTEDTSTVKEPVVNEEIKSLEEIYRERALKSLMDAKRKKIMEQKRKRWETVKTTSESEEGTSQDDNETGKENSVEVKTEPMDDEEKAEVTVKEEEDSSSDSPEDGSDIDLADDVDIEIDAGELEDFEDQSEEKEGESSGHEEEKKKEMKTERRKKEKTEKRPTIAKPSIKSRLGLKAVGELTRQAEREQKANLMQRVRSVKDRLGLRSGSPDEQSDRPVRSGVIKLNTARPLRDNKGEVRITRNLGGIRDYVPKKSSVILPKITIQNKVEERKNSIKQRLGLLEDNGRGKRKRKEIDEELSKLLKGEDVDIEESELDLLTKKEKKKLLKRLLAAQGREEDYDYIVKKKKRKLKRKERDIEEEEREGSRERRIKIKNRLGASPVPEDSNSDVADDEALQYEEEIELAEDVEGTETDEAHKDVEVDKGPKEKVENVPAPIKQDTRTLEEIRREKEARLKKELAPLSLHDIRKKRALKRIHAGGDAENNITDDGRGNRRIILEDPKEGVEKSDPPVRVTFKGDMGGKLRLSRLGEENARPSSLNKPIKLERQIYVPPTAKKGGDKKLLVVNPAGRDVVDYGDVFSKKSESKEDVSEKKASSFVPIKSVSSTEVGTVRQPLRLNRGPPKVEVKDATVKTFAEIMAEKKRKRLLAQQGDVTAKKRYMPVAFGDSGPTTATLVNLSTTTKSRISPSVSVVSDNTEKRTSPVTISSSTQQSSVSSASTLSSSDITPTPTVHQQDSNSAVRGSRWKRRKTNTDNDPPVTSVKEENVVLQEQSVAPPKVELPSQTISDDALLKSPVPREEKPAYSHSLSSNSDKTKRESPGEKKKKYLDSVLDSDDEFLMDDGDDLDLDLANTQDHDELMREIDELLA